MNRRLAPPPMPSGRASFPRTPGVANPAAAQPASALPLVSVFDPPIQAPAAPTPALPSAGLGENYEAKTITFPWPGVGLLSQGEQDVYSTKGQWSACDVYIQDANVLTPSMIISIRVYAIGAQGARTLVASGRYGSFSLGMAGAAQATKVPIWIAGARSQSGNFQVTFQIESSIAVPAFPAAAGQTSAISVVASNRSDTVPDGVGAIPFAPTVNGVSGLTAQDPELLWVSGALVETVATPRYLHLHALLTNPAGLSPRYCFPLGAGVKVAGGGGFGGMFPFPAGTRPQGLVNAYQLVASSTAATTTVVTDVAIQGMYR